MLFNLEKEALSASGIKDRNLMVSYLNKLRFLRKRFINQAPAGKNPLITAKELFKWLWKDRLTRYQSRGNFKLTKVIDSQLNTKAKSVGNCLGLTLLYNCLLRRMGIEAEALYIENAFGIGPHVLTFLQINDTAVDIENSLPDGFDYQGHLNHPNRTRWGNKELVSEVYNSLGNLLFEKGEWKTALINYDRALHIYGNYEKARLNKLILLDKMRSMEK